MAYLRWEIEMFSGASRSVERRPRAIAIVTVTLCAIKRKTPSDMPEEDALPPYRSPAVAGDGIGTVSV